jgi:archaemetzincin
MGDEDWMESIRRQQAANNGSIVTSEQLIAKIISQLDPVLNNEDPSQSTLQSKVEADQQPETLQGTKKGWSAALDWTDQRVSGAAEEGFKPPAAFTRQTALGLTKNPLFRAQLNRDWFEPIPAPTQDDWLWDRTGAGQTYDTWLRSNPNLPYASCSRGKRTSRVASTIAVARNVIYLQPLGDFIKQASPSVNDLQAYAAAFFYGMEVRVMPPIPSSDASFKALKSRQLKGEHRQLKTGSVLSLLRRDLPADAYCIVALTMEDLYPDPSYNFVFGIAMTKARVGVFSFARYDPVFHGEPRFAAYETELLWRSCMVMTHEITHMFNIKHCVYYHCRMNGSNSLEESAARPSDLCPVCLRKLQFASRFNLQGRYDALAAICSDFARRYQDDRSADAYQHAGFARDARWHAERAAACALTSRSHATAAPALASARQHKQGVPTRRRAGAPRAKAKAAPKAKAAAYATTTFR